MTKSGLAAREGALRTVGEWRGLLREPAGAARAMLERIYGDGPLVAQRQQALAALLDTFCDAYGEEGEIVIARSPARINLMGVHVEHRRGEINPLTHGREVLMAARVREDDEIHLCDTEGDEFPPRVFSIGEELARCATDDWVEYIESPAVSEVVRSQQGDWANYVKSAALRLQHEYPEARIRGMDAAVMGDIPRSAGLSSSSAVVVVSALAAMAFGELEIGRGRLAELCGEGEWYVGTRGGAGDHAAMLFGRRGQISRLRFFPFEFLGYVALPNHATVLICNSLRQADKSGSELSAYNETIAAYRMVLLLIKDILVKDLGFAPEVVADRLHHLGDINLNKDLFPDTIVYQVLHHMPARISREELEQRFPDREEELADIFRTHDPPAQGYRPRAVAMFGLAEIARGSGCAEFLEAGDLDSFGELMYVSHDGDRVVVHEEDGTVRPWDNEQTQVTDEYLDRLRAEVEQGVERAALMWQPGGYRCSCEELDQIVDLCRQVPGVYGAGLTGAGLGGCVLVLVEKAHQQAVMDKLRREYYEARGLTFAAEPCVPVEGAGLLRV